MTYCALSDTTNWSRAFASADEVYLWRAQMSGCQPATAADALAILRAVAKAQKLDLDAKAIVISEPAASTSMVDVVMTADSTRPYVIRDSPADIAAAAALDSDLRARYPKLAFTSPELLELTGPADAVDFWRQHDIVWDDTVGPTAAWTAQRGAYVGTADDGHGVKQMSAPAPPPLNGKKNGATREFSADDAIHFVAWTAVGAAASWLFAHLIFSKEQH